MKEIWMDEHSSPWNDQETQNSTMATRFDVTTANLLAQNQRSFTAGYLLVPMAAEMSRPGSQTDGEMGN